MAVITFRQKPKNDKVKKYIDKNIIGTKQVKQVSIFDKTTLEQIIDAKQINKTNIKRAFTGSRLHKRYTYTIRHS